MKKLIVALLVFVFLASGLQVSAGSGRGGFMGFIAGCCFGIRTGAAYNDGKEIHWREWVLLVPIVGSVCMIWNGVEGANGVTSSDLAARYGAMYY